MDGTWINGSEFVRVFIDAAAHGIHQQINKERVDADNRK